MTRAPKQAPDDDAEQQLIMLLNLLAEKMHGDPNDKRRRRISVREGLLLRRRREAAEGDSNAGMLLLQEEQDYAPLRERYLELQRQRSRPLLRYVYGRIMLVPPPLSCQTVSQWLEDGITEEQMLEMERLHAINDERCRLQAPNYRPPVPADEPPEVRRIELPRRPTPEELAEDEAIFEAASAAASVEGSGNAPAVTEEAEDQCVQAAGAGGCVDAGSIDGSGPAEPEEQPYQPGLQMWPPGRPET